LSKFAPTALVLDSKEDEQFGIPKQHAALDRSGLPQVSYVRQDLAAVPPEYPL
jgi:hypothetical protein